MSQELPLQLAEALRVEAERWRFRSQVRRATATLVDHSDDYARLAALLSQAADALATSHRPPQGQS